MDSYEVYLFIYVALFTASLIMTISFYKDKEYKHAIGCTLLTIFTLFASIIEFLLVTGVVK
ncbi:Uncharacterised protein [Staphylococcus xylosus]|uniref:hypothetical protein n=1 Tax=Staphylococcus xylosus TaxID=1288 RepID=UPI00085C8D12|nr:hypothetical protein [Staphylococcus xylosus]SCU31614.1 Uncharacterised protein [Staphylococcus xylosus]